MSQISASTVVKAPLARVWDVFTDLPAAAQNVSGIDKVEELTPPPFAPGYRWRETRRMWGKEATEEMWVTEFGEQRFYEVAAASHGAKYLSRYDFIEVPGGVRVEVTFTGEPQSTLAKAGDLLYGWLAKGSVQKMLRKDLEELAAVCERGAE